MSNFLNCDTLVKYFISYIHPHYIDVKLYRIIISIVECSSRIYYNYLLCNTHLFIIIIIYFLLPIFTIINY